MKAANLLVVFATSKSPLSPRSPLLRPFKGMKSGVIDTSKQCRRGISLSVLSKETEEVANSAIGEDDGPEPGVLMDLEKADEEETTDDFSLEAFTKELMTGIPPEAVIWLNAVAVIWGSQHPVIKMVVEDSDASAFSLVRFAFGALIASPPWWASEPDDESNPLQTWRWGAEMGLWMFLGYAFQAIGLQYTTAQRSGFLLYLNVKFVPFFAFILLGRQISLPTWVSALTAFVGTSLLAYDGSNFDLNVGDAWSIAAAAASAMFILRLEKASVAVKNSAALNASCLWVVSAAALVWTLAASSSSWDTALSEVQRIVQVHPIEVIYLSGVTTALANYIQTRAQQKVSAERASIIYAMDPVYGAMWSNLLLGETLTGLGMVGAGLITVAAATNALLDLGAKIEEKAPVTNQDAKTE